ncbi:extracellular calcium-sensing receptor-like [Lissotriton helveticus]
MHLSECHCKATTRLELYLLMHRFVTRAFRYVHAVAFTVNEINQSPSMLPNITLGFRVYDCCYDVTKSTKLAMCLLPGREKPVPNFQCRSRSPLASVIGDVYSSTGLAIARILGLYRYPQISNGAHIEDLSDKIQFPSFMRTMPNADTVSVGVSMLVKHFGWTWIGLLSLEKDVTRATMLLVRKHILNTGACIAFWEEIPALYSTTKLLYLVEVVRKSSAKAVVAIGPDPLLLPFMEEVARQNLTGIIWIATHVWASSSLLSVVDLSIVLTGTIGFAIPRGVLSGLKEFLYNLNPHRNPEDLFTKEFWEVAFGCTWTEDFTNSNNSTSEDYQRKPLCTGSEDLLGLKPNILDVNNFRLTNNVYNAIYATAHALHNLLSCRPGKGPFLNGTCANIHHFRPWQLLHYLKKVHFQNPEGDEVFFNEKGDPPPRFDILNWQRQVDGSIQHVKVGTFDYSAPEGHQFIINESAILWNKGGAQVPDSLCSARCLRGYRKAAREGQASCCYDCVPCSEEEISNHTDSIECFKCPEDQMPNERQDGCVSKPVEYLSYHEPLGAVLAGISICYCLFSLLVFLIFIRYNQTPVVKANNLPLSYLLLCALILCFLCPYMFIGQPLWWTCLLRQAAFGTIFTLCVSCILAKTITVLLAFGATRPSSKLRNWTGLKVPLCITIACSSLQLLLCAAWLILAPPFHELNFRSSARRIISECNEGSTLAFWLMLGYMGFLATVTLIVAFLARTLPDSFNEAKLITFSMLVFVTVWFSFIPAYLSTRGKNMVAVEVFAILASSAGMLSCIFLPKIYIILLRPEMNTKEHLMGRREKVKQKRY